MRKKGFLKRPTGNVSTTWQDCSWRTWQGYRREGLWHKSTGNTDIFNFTEQTCFLYTYNLAVHHSMFIL